VVHARPLHLQASPHFYRRGDHGMAARAWTEDVRYVFTEAATPRNGMDSCPDHLRFSAEYGIDLCITNNPAP